MTIIRETYSTPTNFDEKPKQVYVLLLQSSNFYISNRQKEDIHTWIAEKPSSLSLF